LFYTKFDDRNSQSKDCDLSLFPINSFNAPELKEFRLIIKLKFFSYLEIRSGGVYFHCMEYLYKDISGTKCFSLNIEVSKDRWKKLDVSSIKLIEEDEADRLQTIYEKYLNISNEGSGSSRRGCTLF